MKDYHINIFYSEADGGYIADLPDLEACSAFGKRLPDIVAGGKNPRWLSHRTQSTIAFFHWLC